MRTPLLTLALSLAAVLATPLAPAHAQASPAAAAADARVIVKYKADSALGRMQALSAGTLHSDRAQALGQRMGMALRAGGGVAERTQVVFASGMSSAALAQRLAGDSNVEYAVPDQRRRILAAPNDPYYLTRALVGANSGGPVSGQWYLRAPAGEVHSSLDVETAWNITQGSTSVVVAVLDTGVRFDHPDLKRVADGGNLLPGYDMINDVLTANDNDGRDNDPSDPGDWISQADINSGNYDPCTAADIADSSWHGTQMAGLVGALTNNGVGMAGVGRNVRVLPVRVLGKCGGFDSDIVAGMRWAAGLAVPGLPANPSPAKVLNLSLGGDGACDGFYPEAVAEILAAGTVIVASAGNGKGHAVASPANCSGVIAVSGLRHLGTKVGYSDIGPQVSISAPAGNCVNEDPLLPCLYPILTTSNAGTTTPAAGTAGSIYTDSFNISVGTSYSAPLVAGTAALMLSAQPALTPAQVRDMMRATARPFPTSGAAAGTPQCVVPTAGSADQLECYCTTSTCGAGMLDAGAAVNAVTGLHAAISFSPASPQSGQVVTFSSAPSLVGTGRSIAGYQWALTSGGGIVTSLTGATNGATVSATPTAAGRFSVSLTLTDNTGLQSTAVSSVDVAAAPLPLPPVPLPGVSDGGGGGGALGSGWLALLGLAVLALRATVPRRHRA
jgi:serine protease